MRNLIVLALVASVVFPGCESNFDSYVDNKDRRNCLKGRYLHKKGLIKCLQSKGYRFEKDPLFSGKLVLIKNED
jgi:hypothetical protein